MVTSVGLVTAGRCAYAVPRCENNCKITAAATAILQDIIVVVTTQNSHPSPSKSWNKRSFLYYPSDVRIDRFVLPFFSISHAGNKIPN